MNNLAPWNSVIKTPIRPTPEGIGAKISPASPTTVADLHALGYATLVVGADIDIPTGHGLVAIYANTMDTKLANLIRTTVFGYFGVTPVRLGNGPPMLYLIATSAPIERARVEFGELDKDGRLKDHVEILSEGRQFVAHGNPYAWPFPLVPFDQLPIATPADIADLLKELRSILPVAKPRIAEGATTDVSQVSPPPAAKPLITEGAASNASQPGACLSASRRNRRARRSGLPKVPAAVCTSRRRVPHGPRSKAQRRKVAGKIFGGKVVRLSRVADI
jgi:hypothetical protein